MIAGYAKMFFTPVIDEGIAGTSVEGDQLAGRPDPSDVGDATDVHEGYRVLGYGGSQGAVIDGHQGSALPAGSHIGCPHVVDHRLIQPAGQERSVAQLHGEADFRPVDDGLAMEANYVDFRIG
jgi:hypothetical protein